MAESNNYTPENDLNLDASLTQDDVYQPEDDLQLTQSLVSTPTFGTTSAAAVATGQTRTLTGGTASVQLSSALSNATGGTADLTGGTATLEPNTATSLGTGADNISLITASLSVITAESQGSGVSNLSLTVPAIETTEARSEAKGREIGTDVIGTNGDVDVLIEGQKIAAYTNIELKKRLNEIDTFKFEAFIEDNDDRALIQEGNIVKFVEGYNDLLFKGVLNEVEYKSSFRAVCEGNGMEQKLLNRKTERETFTNSSGDAIVKDVVPTSVISRGEIESAPQVSVRFDHDNLARAVAGVANATGYDWYVDQEKADDFSEDFLNFVQEAGGPDEVALGTPTQPSQDKGSGGRGIFNITPKIEGFVESISIKLENGAFVSFPQEINVTVSEGFSTPIYNETFTFDDPGDKVINLAKSDYDKLMKKGIEYDVTAETLSGDTSIVSVDIDDRYSDETAYYTMSDGFTPATGDDQVVYRNATREVFDIGSNARLIERNKDQGFIANDITLLGRGDGINQLEANVFAASDQFTDSTEEFNDAIQGYNVSIIENQSKITLKGKSEYNISVAEDGSHLLTAQSDTVFNNDKLRSYKLDQPFELESFSIDTAINTSYEPYDVKVANGGSKLYVTTTAESNEEIKEYSLTTAYDLNTATIENTIVTGLDSSEPVLTISNNGKNLVIADNQGNVRNYVLGTAYDTTTVQNTQDTSFGFNVTGIDFNDAGDKMFLNEFGTIRTYELSTAFDVTTATKINERTTSQGEYVLEWRDNGDFLFLSQRDVGEAGDVTKNIAGERTLSVDDALQLGNQGDELIARAGVENIRAEILDGSTINVLERGLEDFTGEKTKTPNHYKGVRIFLKENVTQGIGPFTPEDRSTAQSGSSIEQFGVREQRETDKTITDLRTLEKAADLELKNRFEDIFRVQVKPTEPRTTKNIDLGDKVEVKDLTAMDVDDSFKVTGIDAQRASAGEGTTLHLANRPRRLTERLRDIESNTDTLNAHMQGATNLTPLNFRDNADNSNPIIADLYVPDDAVAVNKVDLKAKRQSFRGFVKADTTSDNSSTGEFLNATQTLVNPGGSIPEPFSSATVEDSPTGDDTGAIITGQIVNKSGGLETYDYELENSSTSTVLKSGSLTINDNEQKTINFNATSEDVSQNDSIKFSIINNSLDTEAGIAGHSQINIYVNTKSEHSHDLLGEQDFGIFQPNTEPGIDVDVVVDGNIVKTVNNIFVGDEIGPIDVQPYLDTPLAGDYHEIKLVPKDAGGGNNGRSRFTVDVNGKIFIESTLQ